MQDHRAKQDKAKQEKARGGKARRFRIVGREVLTLGALSILYACGSSGAGADGGAGTDAAGGSDAGAGLDGSAGTDAAGGSDAGAGLDGSAGTDAAEGSDSGAGSDGGADALTGHLRVVHLSPGTPAFDVIVDGTLRVFEDVAFDEGTDYVPVPAGSHTLDLEPASGSGARLYELTDALVPEDGLVTAVFFGNPPPSAIYYPFEGRVLVDDSAGLSASDVRLTFVHVALGRGPLTMTAVVDPDGAFPRMFPGVSFGVPASIDVPAGSHTFAVRGDDGIEEYAFDLPALTAGTVANIYFDGAGSRDATPHLMIQGPTGPLVRVDVR